MRIRKILIGLVLLLLVVAAAAGFLYYRATGTFPVAIPAELSGDAPGAIVSVERTGKYPAFVVRTILKQVDLATPLDPSRGVTLYRVVYRTTNFDGSAVSASGLLVLPNGSGDSVVTYLHGTNPTRSTAPSQPGLNEGLFMATAAAGRGHVLVAPDYIGLGESQTMHPYMHAKTETSATIDLLAACRELVEHLGESWPEPLFLIGFSQGGHAAFAVQRELERQENPPFTVTASASIAGPFHLRDVSLRQAMSGTTDSHAFYLGYVSTAYAHIYGQSLGSLLVEPYLAQAPVLFDGNHDYPVISDAIPEHPRELFTAEFLRAYDEGETHWFLDALTENDVHDWTPRAPIRLYFGDDDLDVAPEEARRAEAAMKARGADITAISVGAHDHEGSAFQAIPKALLWFEEVLQSAAPSA